MATEESALLGDHFQPQAHSAQHVLPTEDVYDRFTRKQKRVILRIITLTGLLPMFISSSFVPSIPQISRDLNAIPADVSLGVSLSVLASSFGVLFWSGYVSFYGRRPVYLAELPFTVLGSFAAATSTDLTSLLFWRVIQAFGCAGGFFLGAAIVGDIYKLEERGTAMGTVFGFMLFGLAIAPPIGGFLTQYWSWRGLQVTLGVWGVIQTLLLALFLPETAHPGSLGIEKEQGFKKLRVWINPFYCLTFLRSPNIMAITLATTWALFSDYTLMVPIAYTLGAKYGISDEGLIGALCFPAGLGAFLGAPVAGYLSDMTVRRAKAECKDAWVPEHRLRVVWLGGLVMIPLCVTLSGFTTTYIGGMVGLVVNFVCFFANGIGIDLVLTPIETYIVDVMPDRNSEINAAIVVVRSSLLALAITWLIPSVQTIGVAATNSITALLVLFGYFLIWLTIRYGKQMRAYVDIGYPDFDCHARTSDSTPT